MSDLLKQAWASGRLVRPDGSKANTVDLVRALSRLGGRPTPGMPGGDSNEAAIAAGIGPADHLVFVLIDGMGLNLLSQLPTGSFLPAHVAMELQPVFPSTTSAAITTITTGLWPGEHGILGWWTYLAEHSLSVTTLLCTQRVTDKPLEQLGLTAHAIWPFEPLLTGFGHDVRAICPVSFWDSTFNRYARGGRDGAGYTSIPSAIDQVVGRVATAKRPTFTYLYMPELDKTCHEWGTSGEQTLAVLAQLDREMARLADGLAGRARLVISADHGHQNVAQRDHLPLLDGDELLETLVVPPTGEPRVPCFHVRPGLHEPFQRIFRQRYGERIALLSAQEADDLRLFGPEPLSALARQHLGDYVGATLDPVTLRYYEPGALPTRNHASHHGGMSPGEMRVPLILA